jgi:hypothetical protein
MKRLAVAAVIIFCSTALADGNSFGGQVSVTTSAQTVTALLSLNPALNARQLSIKIDPASANTIYCGGSTVTNVPANARIAISNASSPSYTWGGSGPMMVATNDIYCVATTGTTTAFVNGVQ